MLRKIILKIAATACPEAWAKVNNWRRALAEKRHWDSRIADVYCCPDNDRIPRVPDAGKIKDGFQVMHNGIHVLVDGYYGKGITRMLAKNRGCHEPQEEVVFGEVLQSLPEGATMLEAGAYWGFYSMWFCQEIAEAKVFLIEPEDLNYAIGKKNFLKNNYAGDFTQAYVGAAAHINSNGKLTVTIESFMKEKGIERLDILHADVQGFEFEMLTGAANVFKNHLIDYIFLSTHSADLHEQCAGFLRSLGYRLIASLDLEQTCSVDGILVACSPLVKPPDFKHPSQKRASISNS